MKSTFNKLSLRFYDFLGINSQKVITFLELTSKKLGFLLVNIQK